MKSNPVRVLLVDDHRIFRDGIVSMFQVTGEVDIAGLASNGTEAIQQIHTLKPDVVVLDLSMPGIGGLEVLRSARNAAHRPGFLVLSMHTDIAFVKEALSSGARGYICKEDTDRTELLEAIKTVAQGGSYFGKTIRDLMQQQFVTGLTTPGDINDDEPGLEVLSRRETEILKLVMEGMSNQEIADANFVSIRTVEAHKNNIMTKLNLKNTVELVKYAIRHKFFEV
ncbi:MAG: response regulator transcription factor [Bacteroidales bacterium]